MRLRSENFKDPDLSLDDLAQCPGVESFVMNTLTGSLLVEYDPATLNPLKALQVLNRLDPGALQQYAEYVQRSGGDPEELFSRDRAPIRGTDAEAPARRGLAPTQKEIWNEFVGLALSLAALAVSGFVGKKRFHVMTGLIFLEATAQHVWRYRRKIHPPRPSSRLGDYLTLPSEDNEDKVDDGSPKPSRTPELGPATGIC